MALHPYLEHSSGHSILLMANQLIRITKWKNYDDSCVHLLDFKLQNLSVVNETGRSRAAAKRLATTITSQATTKKKSHKHSRAH